MTKPRAWPASWLAVVVTPQTFFRDSAADRSHATRFTLITCALAVLIVELGSRFLTPNAAAADGTLGSVGIAAGWFGAYALANALLLMMAAGISFQAAKRHGAATLFADHRADHLHLTALEPFVGLATVAVLRANATVGGGSRALFVAALSLVAGARLWSCAAGYCALRALHPDAPGRRLVVFTGAFLPLVVGLGTLGLAAAWLLSSIALMPMP
jgi:hypothetical protein